MVSEIKLLLLLDPADAYNVDASERAVSKITIMMGRQWEVHFTSSQPFSYRKMNCHHVVHRVRLVSSLHSMLSRALYLFFSIYEGVKIVREYGIQVVMTTGGHLHVGLPAYIISRITKRKCILRVNEDDVLAIILFVKSFHKYLASSQLLLRTLETVLRKMESSLFAHVDWVVTHGPMDFEKIRKLTLRVTFVPLWVDTEKFKQASGGQAKQLRRKLIGIEENVKVILFVGRLHPEKDVETLFYSFKKVLEAYSDAILVVVGVGPQGKRCREIVEMLGITNKVKFVGYVPHEQMPDYYNVADVYVLTSIWEELSNTIMEAMASGVPAIVTDVGGNPYLVENGKTGFLVPPRNSSAMARKIVYVLDHLDELKTMISLARLQIGKYDKESIGELYKRTILGVLRRVNQTA